MLLMEEHAGSSPSAQAVRIGPDRVTRTRLGFQAEGTARGPEKRAVGTETGKLNSRFSAE